MMRNFDDMNRMLSQMDEMFGQMGSGHGDTAENTTNLFEQDDAYVFVMDLPGFEREEIELVYHDGHLKISAVTEIDESEETMYRRHARSITETVSLPGEIAVEEISATYHNGVLEVRLPMLEGSVDDGHHIDVR
jgi:HSP20 family protein